MARAERRGHTLFRLRIAKRAGGAIAFVSTSPLCLSVNDASFCANCKRIASESVIDFGRPAGLPDCPGLKAVGVSFVKRPRPSLPVFSPCFSVDIDLIIR